MRARKRKPTKVVIEQFFEFIGNTGVDKKYESYNPNCLQCGVYVLPEYQILHVEWHIKLTKILDGKREKQ